MLEKDIIQQRGFHNIYDENGKAIGFQFRVRSEYYRGIWLSLIRPGDVIVDGEVFGKDKIKWNIGGVDYTLDEMLKVTDIQWPIDKAAVIKVKKEGGLSIGYHDVSVEYRLIMSYIPPVVNSDEAFERMPAKPFTRRILLVN